MCICYQQHSPRVQSPLPTSAPGGHRDFADDHTAHVDQKISTIEWEAWALSHAAVPTSPWWNAKTKRPVDPTPSMAWILQSYQLVLLADKPAKKGSSSKQNSLCVEMMQPNACNQKVPPFHSSPAAFSLFHPGGPQAAGESARHPIPPASRRSWPVSHQPRLVTFQTWNSECFVKFHNFWWSKHKSVYTSMLLLYIYVQFYVCMNIYIYIHIF